MQQCITASELILRALILAEYGARSKASFSKQFIWNDWALKGHR
jgi:hypothetical protein